MADLLETATSARSRCRACGEPIEKSELRFGERLPNPFADGEATYWFHLACAACTRSEKLLPLLGEAVEPAERERLERVARIGIEHPRVTRLLRAERSPSARARCRSCKQLIAAGAWRLGLGIFEEGRMEPIGFIHVECSKRYFETDDVLERVALLSPTLSTSDVQEIARALAATPPASMLGTEVAASAGPIPKLSDTPSTSTEPEEPGPRLTKTAGEKTRPLAKAPVDAPALARRARKRR